MSDEKPTHTPGPWYVAVGNIDGPCITGILAGPVWVVGNIECPIKNEADARLIAAAPEMLAALKQAQNALYFAQNPESRGAAQVVGAAIAKAEGRTP